MRLRKKIFGAGKGQVRASNESFFASCQLSPLSHKPFSADENSSVSTERGRVAPGVL